MNNTISVNLVNYKLHTDNKIYYGLQVYNSKTNNLTILDCDTLAQVKETLDYYQSLALTRGNIIFNID